MTRKKNITKKEVEKALKNVFDPELGINIVDLGLIYNILIDNILNQIKVVMTLTSPLCPFNSFILENVEAQLKQLGFNDVKIEITFDPLWSPSRINKKIKLANVSIEKEKTKKKKSTKNSKKRK